MPLIYLFVVFIFGLTIGSFLNVLIWRLPREQSVAGRSQCPVCSHQLVWLDLIPVVSFLIGFGKCCYCHEPISIRYPLIELIAGVLFCVFAFLMPVTDWVSLLQLLLVLYIVAISIVIFVIDLEHYLILDKIIFPSVVVILLVQIGLAVLLKDKSVLMAVMLTAVLGPLPFWMMWKLSKGLWMGLGDVKLMVLMGLALGPVKYITALLLAIMLGALVGILLILLGRKQLSSKLPFGTFLTIGTLLALSGVLEPIIQKYFLLG